MLTFIFWFIIIVLIIVLNIVGGALMWFLGDFILLILGICLVSKLFKKEKKEKNEK